MKGTYNDLFISLEGLFTIRVFCSSAIYRNISARPTEPEPPRPPHDPIKVSPTVSPSSGKPSCCGGA